MTPRVQSAFLPIWTIAVAGTVSAFVVHLALRGRTVQLAYELGRAHQQQARLREVERVLQVEAASYKTPERVEFVARTLLGMEQPSPDRIVPLAPLPAGVEPEGPSAAGSTSPPTPSSPHAAAQHAPASARLAAAGSEGPP